jgi:DMSO/TMAO reductase YedYZ molybdopterin-dependent catalytic subunit
MGRRAFVVTAAASAALAPVAAVVGRALQQRVDASASRRALAAARPNAYGPTVATPAGADLGVRGVALFVTPNHDFYRIDTAIVVPQVAAEGWSLRVHGRVARELVLDYDELLARPAVDRHITLACVSNLVGGDLIGNASWRGVPLRDLLLEAGVEDRADQVVGRSVDGFTAGFPLAAALDGRDALVAYGMNGEPLPVRHGFPVRLVVPGLYGYVSATKWLSEIELTRFDDFDAYWVRLDWELPRPIAVQSRIDVPGDRVRAGAVVVAGVAWAQHRGVARVEVRVDRGPWREAELATVPSTDTWRQWRWAWDAEPGRHLLEARATATDGEVQSDEGRSPFPGPASGWHRRSVDVR